MLTEHLPVTRAIGDALRDREMLEAWDARFTVAGSTVALPDLLMVRPAVCDTAAVAAIIRTFQAPAVELVGLHRISLYRSGALAAAAASLGPAGDARRTEPPRAAGRAAADIRRGAAREGAGRHAAIRAAAGVTIRRNVGPTGGDRASSALLPPPCRHSPPCFSPPCFSPDAPVPVPGVAPVAPVPPSPPP